MVNRVCDYKSCSKKFKIVISKVRKLNFCSRKCQGRYQTAAGTVLVTCEWKKCRRKFRKHRSQVRLRRHNFCCRRHSNLNSQISEWLKDAKRQLSMLKYVRKRARKYGNSNGWLNGWGEGLIRYEGRLRAHEDKHLKDCFQHPAQIRTHDWFISIGSPIIVRWFALGRYSRPFVFENIYEFEKGLRLIVETGRLPERCK